MFWNCTSLKKITIPNSVTSIGEDVFLGAGYLRISCYADSAAEKYAKENGFAYKIIDKSGKNLVVAIAVGAVAVIAVVVIKKKKQKTAE